MAQRQTTSEGWKDSLRVLAILLAPFFLLPIASALNVTSIGVTDENYDEPPYVTGSRLDAVVAYTDCDSSCNATVSLYAENRTLLSSQPMAYDTGGRFVYEESDVVFFEEADTWTAEVSLENATNTTTAAERFHVRKPVELSLFIILSAISVLCIGVGLTGNRIFGILGVIIMFFLGLFILQGQLALPDGSIETVDGSTTVKQDTFDNWNNGYYHTIGFLIAIIGGFLFVVFLMDPGGNA